MNAIETEHLTHVYPARRKVAARTALSDVNLSIASGAVFALLGPNGGGKTTLFKILSTMLTPTSGRASVFGADVVTQASGARAALGVVFQHPSLDKKLTLWENVLYQGRLYGLSGADLAARAQEALEKLSLWDRRGDLAEQLSGGLQRRVEIAKSLLHRPKLLLMDEPSTGLDPGARREMWDYVTTLRNDGVTVVFTTHLMEEGDRCDRVAIVSGGRIITDGAPADLKSQIGGDIVTVKTNDAAALAGQIKTRFHHDAQALDGTVRVEIREGHTFVPSLVEAFPGAVEAISVGKPTLEDVFIHVTGRRYADESEGVRQ